MKKYEILPHPAELRLKIYGKTLMALFTNAAFALAIIQNKNIALHRRSSIKRYKEKIKIKSIDINSLLVDFLSEILAKSQINKCVYFIHNSYFKIHNSSLEAELIGYPVDHFDEDIKAVTYQDVNIHQRPTTNNQQPIWQTEIVFDV